MHKNLLGLGLSISAALSTAACWGGGGSGATADTATYPQLGAVTLPDVCAGDVPIEVTLVDPASRPADLTVEVTHDGVTWRAATLCDPDTARGLSTSPEGERATLLWDSYADLGFRDAPRSQLRVRARAELDVGPQTWLDLPPLDNLRSALAHVEHHMVHYGPFDEAAIGLAHAHDLVVVHVFSGSLTVDTVRRIQRGANPDDPTDDVIVLAYISVGEDLRTIGLSDAQMLLDPRFVGDASGPRVDPRGPDADGQSLLGLDPLGAPTNSPTGTRYASWFLDDNSIDNSATDTGDGLPDRNSAFGGCFVNAGDPAWFDVLDAMRFDGVDGMPGMRELLTDDSGRGYACDGLFFDTFDTCAPNFYTDETSFNQSEFEWTAPGFRLFAERFHERYPDKIALQNRGMFFFDPRLPHYQVTTRSFVDVVLVESYRLDSNTFEQFNAYFTADNKHNYAPKLLAEAGRPDGFRVLSLGYAEGPGIEHGTLLGTSGVGLETLLTDIAEAHVLAGFKHYLTDAGVALPNRFVLDNTPVDAAPPVWSSTYNDNVFPWPTSPGSPTPRPGLRRAVPGDGRVRVSWDIAQDQSRVGYALYLQQQPFDFVGDPGLDNARREVLVPEIGEGYAELGVGPDRYPFEATVHGLTNGETWWACLRAFDEHGHEEQNQVVRTFVTGSPSITIDGSFDDWTNVALLHSDADDVPPSNGPDWLDIAMHHDASNLYLHFSSANPFNLDGSPGYSYSRALVFFDVDGDPLTGWSIGGLGSDVVLAGDELFRQTSTNFNDGSLGTIAVAPVTAVVECEAALPWSVFDAIVPGADELHVLFVNDEVYDYAPDTGWSTYRATR